MRSILVLKTFSERVRQGTLHFSYYPKRPKYPQSWQVFRLSFRAGVTTNIMLRTKNLALIVVFALLILGLLLPRETQAATNTPVLTVSVSTLIPIANGTTSGWGN
jgi:hypothetical protein